jgi:hypothetical protein
MTCPVWVPKVSVGISITLEGDSREYQMRVQWGEWVGDLRERLQALHPDKVLGEMLHEGGEMTEDEPTEDWISSTGFSRMPTQRKVRPPRGMKMVNLLNEGAAVVIPMHSALTRLMEQATIRWRRENWI